MILDREDLEHYNLPGIREKLQANENRIKQLRNDKLDPVYASDELLCNIYHIIIIEIIYHY